MKLGLFISNTNPSGNHAAAWRHPDTPPDLATNYAHWVHIARTAEQGKFDMLFMADSLAIPTDDMRLLAESPWGCSTEPLILMAALSSITKNIGLAATATTTYNEPYHIARKFAALDHLSSGRTAWNIVTSVNHREATNFGTNGHASPIERYERAEEFTDVVMSLWDSWQDDAFLHDKAAARFSDPSRLHIPHHCGKYFTVRGPLQSPRPPQGYPVLIQAGMSNEGRELTARVADVVFSAANSLEQAKEFYKDVRIRAMKHGRAPDELKVLPGVMIYVAPTQEQAEAKHETLQNLLTLQIGLRMLSLTLGEVDLSSYPLDEPLPESAELAQATGHTARRNLVIEEARRDKLTLREMAYRAGRGRSHWTLTGTPAQVVDRLEEWFCSSACDGFNIMAPFLPGGLEDFVALVVPELRRRGLFRTEYEGKTLRENLGLRRPPPGSRMAASVSAPITQSGKRV